MRAYISILFILFGALFFTGICSSCSGTRALSERRAEKMRAQVWVITGASGGLGKGIATEAAKAGAKVVLVARGKDVLDNLAVALRSNGVEVKVYALDIADSAAVHAMKQSVVATWGGVDVWINNAGVSVFGYYNDVPLEAHLRVIDVNLKGTLICSYYALQLFLVQGHGRLINIVSAESRLPTPFQAAYASSKAALKSYGVVMRQEMRLKGVENVYISSIDPWAMNTPIWDNAANYSGHAPTMGMMDHTKGAINVVLRAATASKGKDYAVGWKTHVAYTFQRIAPRLANRIAANIVYKHQIKESPRAEDRTGNLYEPSENNQIETDIIERSKQYRKTK